MADHTAQYLSTESECQVSCSAVTSYGILSKYSVSLGLSFPLMYYADGLALMLM